MVKKKSRRKEEERRTKKGMSMRKLRAFKKKRSGIKKLVLPKPSNISTKEVCWDTRAPNSRRSNPDIIITMNKYK